MVNFINHIEKIWAFRKSNSKWKTTEALIMTRYKTPFDSQTLCKSVTRYCFLNISVGACIILKDTTVLSSLLIYSSVVRGYAYSERTCVTQYTSSRFSIQTFYNFFDGRASKHAVA